MKKILKYFISLLLLAGSISASGQDTLSIPLNLKIGVDVFNPLMSLVNKNISGLEGFAGVDINENMTAVFEGGYLDYSYSQYNYSYGSKGNFFRIGVDFNSMKPKIALGKYYAGIGIRYGFSVFQQETKELEHENYWGKAYSNISSKNYSAHFIEVSPGIRSEVFKNFSMGWNIKLRILLYSSTEKDLRPLYLPGFGNSTKSFSKGFNYYLVWNIPYKNKRVITKPPVIVEPAE
jgi:hypothetical protein